ncbi:MAG: UbiA prenyltransferase family protein [Candidatus Geothermincolia bacterium]
MKYIRLFRLKSTLIYLFPFVLALSVGIQQVNQHVARPVAYTWYTVLFAYLAYFCGSFFSSTLNFYADVPADKLHDGMYKDQDISKQPFVTGEVSKTEGFIIMAVTGVGCVVFSVLVNLRFAAFMVGAVLLLGVLYSHPWFRFKEKPVLDIVTNATGAVLILIAGMAIVSRDYPPAIPMIFGWLFSAAMYMPSVANDVPFDKAAGYRTSGVVFGQKRLVLAMIPTVALMVPVGIWGVFSSSLNWQYRLFCLLGTGAAILATATVWLLYNPPHIELNPDIYLVPLAGLLLFYFVVSIVGMA